MTTNVKLSNIARDKIIGRAMANAFADEHKALKKRLALLGMRCYRTHVSAAQEKIARQSPEEWLSLTNTLKLEFYHEPTVEKPNGWHLTTEKNVEIDKAVPFRGTETLGYVHVVNDGLYADYVAIRDARADIKKRTDELREKIRQLVYSTSSLKKLIELWPEVEGFLPTDLTAPKTYLPATLATDINAELKSAGIKFVAPQKATGGLVAVAA